MFSLDSISASSIERGTSNSRDRQESLEKTIDSEREYNSILVTDPESSELEEDYDQNEVHYDLEGEFTIQHTRSLSLRKSSYYGYRIIKPYEFWVINVLH